MLLYHHGNVDLCRNPVLVHPPFAAAQHPHGAGAFRVVRREHLHTLSNFLGHRIMTGLRCCRELCTVPSPLLMVFSFLHLVFNHLRRRLSIDIIMNPSRGESNDIVIGTVQSRTDYLGEQILVRHKVLFFLSGLAAYVPRIFQFSPAWAG